MSAVVLAELTPRAAATGAATTVRMCWNARERANFLGQQWLPAITALPEFETILGYDGSRFGAGASPTVGQLQFALSADTAGLAGMVWKGATITLRRAAWRAGKIDPADGDFAVIWSGRIDAATVDEGIVTLTMIDAGDVLRRPVIDRRFGSSGVAVLDAAAAVALKGRPVPMGWGRLESVPCLLLDAANLIYLVLGQPADSVSAFYDGGAAFTLGTARANLAALIANVPASGRVDYCLNAGGLCLARPWTRPVYPLTADLRAGTTTAAAIAQAVVTSRTSLAFVSGAISALAAAQPADCGLYVDDDATIATVLDRLLAGIGAVWVLTAGGQIEARQVTSSGASALTVARWARSAIRRRQIVMPARRFTLGYKPNWRLHGDGEIAQSLLAEDVRYADGTPVEALKPAEAGANLTAPANANRVPFSRFENGMAGWPVSFNPSGRPSESAGAEVEGRRVGMYRPAFSAAGQEFAFRSQIFPVIGGTRLSMQGRVGIEDPASASDWSFAIGFFDAAGAPISFAGPPSGGPVPAWRDPPLHAFVDVPTNARTAYVQVYVRSSAANSPLLVLSEPMVTSALPAQTLRPAFSPGPNAADGATVGAPAGTLVAGQDAATLVADAATAKSNAASALSTLSVIADDSYLSRDEKPAVRLQRDAVYASFPIVAARADALAVSRTALNTAQAALWDYIGTLALDSATDTAISRATFNGRWSDYYAAETDVLDRIAAKAATLATWSGVTGTGRPQDGATVGAPTGTAVAGVDASTLVTNVDSKAQTFNQTLAPTSPQIGWLWTVPGENVQRRWNGTAWEAVLVATGSAQVEAAIGMPTSGTEQVLFTQTLGVGPAGTVIVSADLAYTPSPGTGGASVNVELAAYYRTTPGSGSWIALSPPQNGTAAIRGDDIAPGEPGPVTPGAVVISRSVAGPGSFTNWQFQIRGRISDGSGGVGSGTGRVRWS